MNAKINSKHGLCLLKYSQLKMYLYFNKIAYTYCSFLSPSHACCDIKTKD